jgi:hypothetical protein
MQPHHTDYTPNQLQTPAWQAHHTTGDTTACMPGTAPYHPLASASGNQHRSAPQHPAQPLQQKPLAQAPEHALAQAHAQGQKPTLNSDTAAGPLAATAASRASQAATRKERTQESTARAWFPQQLSPNRPRHDIIQGLIIIPD